jgi:hypothetical protein
MLFAYERYQSNYQLYVERSPEPLQCWYLPCKVNISIMSRKLICEVKISHGYISNRFILMTIAMWMELINMQYLQ